MNVKTRLERLTKALRSRGGVWTINQQPGETEAQMYERGPRGKLADLDLVVFVRRFSVQEDG